MRMLISHPCSSALQSLPSLFSCIYCLFFTDHNPLTFIHKMKNKNWRLFRMSLTLQEHNQDIRHIKGKDNIQTHILGLRCHCIVGVKFCAIALYCSDLIQQYCFACNCSLLQKKAFFHKTFFSLKRGSVTCMMFICLIYCLLGFC